MPLEVLALFNGPGSEVPVQVVPQGIESVYGSDINMGCTSPLVDRGGVMVCENSVSYLVDGCSPAIDTSTSNWASQLVTVRKTPITGQTTHDGVVLTFNFDTAVFPTSIELDLYLCSRWNSVVHTPYVYADQNSSLVLSSTSTPIRGATLPGQSCDSLSTVRFSTGEVAASITRYHSWHIVVALNRNNDWAYVGDVRFFINNIANPGKYMYTCNNYGIWHVYQPNYLQIQAALNQLPQLLAPQISFPLLHMCL